MKKCLIPLVGLALGMSSTAATAAGGGAVMSFNADSRNVTSVQSGASNFMNYCSGCHGLKLLRYNRIGEDLGLPLDVVEKNLMFTTDKAVNPINTAMPAVSAEWFGRTPPDLSLTSRLRGPDWVYSFLNTFCVDSSKPTGVNNLQLPGASMPHVLGDLQGYQALDHHEGDAEHHGPPSFTMVKPGQMDAAEYKKFTTDLTNFLAYAAEPGKADRISVGFGVIAFLFVLFGLSYMLKHEYWKDVH